MANITVSPTRMELTRLKGKLKTAQRGHKLLKDKRDELMKQFLDTVREVRSLRAEVEEDLMRVHKSFTGRASLRQRYLPLALTWECPPAGARNLWGTFCTAKPCFLSRKPGLPFALLWCDQNNLLVKCQNTWYDNMKNLKGCLR